jgi:hypothetical protein
MRVVLLGVAAVAAIAVPANAGAQNFAGGAALETHHVGVVVGDRRDGRFDCGISRDGFRHHGRRDRGVVECSSGLWVNGGEWALYNNRAFDSDSYNDWWHDRPDRAYPRWVQEQRGSSGCDPDRMWYSGSGWHC